MARSENRRFTGTRSWLALLLGMLAAFHPLAGCMSEIAGTGDETHTGISVSGRILERDGTPFRGAVVTAMRAGLSDTTDADGRYHIEGQRASNGGAALARLAALAVETLLVTKDGKDVARLSVQAWSADIADLQVARYSIRGSLFDRPLKPVALAQAAVSAGAGVVRVVGLAYDSATLGFAGDFYLPAAGVPVGYSINVTVLGRDGRVVARAPAAVLDSRASGLEIPAFSTVPREDRGGLRVVIVGKIAVKEGIAVTAGAQARWEDGSEPDPQDSLSWDWRIGSEPWQSSEGVASSSIEIPGQEPGGLPVAVRVRGANGEEAMDSVVVSFLPRNRLRLSIAPLPDSFTVGDTLRIEAEATDSTPGATTTMEMKWGDGAWRAVEWFPAIVLTKPDTGTRIVLRARSEAPGVWAGTSTHYQVSVEDTLVVRVRPAPLPGEWDFEDGLGLPEAGYPGKAPVFASPNSTWVLQLFQNRISPIGGGTDLEFRWFGTDSLSIAPGGEGSTGFVGFEMPLHRGFEVDLARQLQSIELLLRKDIGGADLRIGLVSPEYPLEAVDSDLGQALLGWDVRIGPGATRPVSLDLATAAFPAGVATVSPFGAQVVYDDALRGRVLARVTALRVTVVDAWPADAAADSPGLEAGALRLDNIRFVPVVPR